MARPTRTNAEYFYHPASFRNDRRVKAIRARFGACGYGLLMMLIETLTDADNIELPTDEMEIELLAGDLSATVEDVTALIQAAEKVGLFARSDAGLLKCPQLDEWLAPVFDKRNRSRNAPVVSKLSQPVTETGVSVTVIPPVENSTVENSTEQESKEVLTTSSLRSEDAATAAASEQEKKIELVEASFESPADQKKPPVAANKNTTGGEDWLTLRVWKKNVEYTEFIQIGAGTTTENAAFADKTIASANDLPETIKSLLLKLVRTWLTSIASEPKPSQERISTPFELSASEKLSAQHLSGLTDELWHESPCSISLVLNQQEAWSGSVLFVGSPAAKLLFSTLTASSQGKMGATTWQAICKCFAPIATSAAATTCLTGGNKPPRSPKVKPDEPEHFAAFWQAYPRHDDRTAAVAAFRKLSPTDQQAAAQRAAAWLSARPDLHTTRGDFRPHAATWLNKTRWTDAAPTVAPPQPTQSHANPSNGAQQNGRYHTTRHAGGFGSFADALRRPAPGGVAAQPLGVAAAGGPPDLVSFPAG